MKSETFRAFIRGLRKHRNLPMRNVAAQMDIDTSTLSKVERGDRPISIEYLKPLCEILLVDPIDIQISFITDKINRDLGQLEFIEEGLKAAQQQVKENQN